MIQYHSEHGFNDHSKIRGKIFIHRGHESIFHSDVQSCKITTASKKGLFGER